MAKGSETQLHLNQPFDESLDVNDAESIASAITPSPRRPGPLQPLKNGLEVPPRGRMDVSDDDFDSAPTDRHRAPKALLSPGLNADRPRLTVTIPPTEPRGIEAIHSKEQPMRGHGRGLQPSVRSSDEGAPSGTLGKSDDGSEPESGSGDDDDDVESDGGTGGGVAMAHGAYDPAEFQGLQVSPDVQDLFQYIVRYAPQTIELETKLKPFIPDFIPAVGDIDAFIKIPRPDGKPDALGLTVVDEPAVEQSDPTVLDLMLRQQTKTSAASDIKIQSVQKATSNTKPIDNWIKNIGELHKMKPPPTVHYARNMPDIDNLMQEWPAEFEQKLKIMDSQGRGLPSADLDCTLEQYTDLICGFLDIPVYKSRVQSLHLLFTLYMEFKNSQHFRKLAEDDGSTTQKETMAS